MLYQPQRPPFLAYCDNCETKIKTTHTEKEEAVSYLLSEGWEKNTVLFGAGASEYDWWHCEDCSSILRAIITSNTEDLSKDQRTAMVKWIKDCLDDIQVCDQKDKNREDGGY